MDMDFKNLFGNSINCTGLIKKFFFCNQKLFPSVSIQLELHISELLAFFVSVLILYPFVLRWNLMLKKGYVSRWNLMLRKGMCQDGEVRWS